MQIMNAQLLMYNKYLLLVITIKQNVLEINVDYNYCLHS